MNLRDSTLLVLVLGVVSVLCAGCPGPAVYDISPNRPNNTTQSTENTAGRIFALGGDESSLYAVTHNAGIWRSTTGERTRSGWRQLAGSPPLAMSIAVDPSNAGHIAAGERTDATIVLDRNRTGVWESWDSGEHWKMTFNPLTEDDCRNGAFVTIPSVVFSSQSTLIIATPCGIVRMATDGTITRTPESEPVTAVASGRNNLWARTQHLFLFSDTDGKTWRAFTFPLNFTPISGGDTYSLAAFDSQAYMTAGESAPSLGTNFSLLGVAGPNGEFRFQRVHCAGSDLVDGTGLGGRRFVKAFDLARPDLSDQIGARLQVYYSEGQNVCRALGIDSQGIVTNWERVASTTAGIESGDQIHSDIWDVLGSSDGKTVWLADDGGIYARGPATGANWVTQNDALHTQHVHSLSVLSQNSGPLMAYATHDNDGWTWDASTYGTPATGWTTSWLLGDAEWTAADAGSPHLALIVRHASDTLLTDFGLTPPTGAKHTHNELITPYCFVVFDDKGVPSCGGFPPLFGPEGFSVIQTLANEPAIPSLDTIMLVSTPLSILRRGQVVPVSGAVGGAVSTTGGPLLLRSTAFASNPDANESSYANWAVESANVPVNTKRVWASGGHSSPVYYAYAIDDKGVTSLYRRSPPTTVWDNIGPMLGSSRLIDVTSVPPKGGGFVAWRSAATFGPVYPNPWDTKHAFALTNRGVGVWLPHGLAFTADDVLTALITESGAYRIGGCYSGQNGAGAPLDPPQDCMATISCVAFNREKPHEVAVASPFTGVYFAENDERHWRNLTPYFPKPLPSVSSLSFDGNQLYASTEGRGVFRISGYAIAPFATYFKEVIRISVPGKTIQLMRSDGNPVAGATVEVETLDHSTVSHSTATSDASGMIQFNSYIPGSIIHLEYSGDADSAPAKITVKLS